jgi:hypothetical protein
MFNVAAGVSALKKSREGVLLWTAISESKYFRGFTFPEAILLSKFFTTEELAPGKVCLSSNQRTASIAIILRGTLEMHQHRVVRGEVAPVIFLYAPHYSKQPKESKK